MRTPEEKANRDSTIALIGLILVFIYIMII